MHAIRGCSLLFMLALAGCGAGDSTTPAVRPAMQGGAATASAIVQGGTVQGADIAYVPFAGNISQYIVHPVDKGFEAFDISNGQVTQLAAASRLRFADSALALDPESNPGKAFRLYQAMFSREPDLVGLGFHIASLDRGVPIDVVGDAFVNSQEFQVRYGALSNADFVVRLYRNVLGREPDEGGRLYHLGYLEGTHPDGIKLTRSQVLINFSESIENKNLTRDRVKNGIEYIPWESSLPAVPLAKFAGRFDGNLMWADNGTVQFVLDAAGGLQANGFINGPNVQATGSTRLEDGGRFTMAFGGSNTSMTLKGSVNAANGFISGAWSNAQRGTSGAFTAAPAAVVVTPDPQPQLFAQVKSIVAQRCVACHSAHTSFPGYNVAQAGISFDTDAQIRTQAALIKAEAVDSLRMPFGNATGMTQAERNALAAWFAAGTP